MYRPHRDERFEHIWDLMLFIEERQCVSCLYQSDRDDAPMCFEIEVEIIAEEPVEALDDHGEQGVVCTRYRSEEPHSENYQDPDQLTLF